MKFYILYIIIILFSELIVSKSEENSTINEINNSNLQQFKDMEGQCYAYCFKIVQPVLEHTVSIQTKEQQIQDQSIIIRNLENQLANLQAKLGIYEESVKNKDLILAEQLLSSEKYRRETTDKLRDNEETIKKKELQLTDQLIASEKSKNELSVKLLICEDTSQKLKNEAIDRKNEIIQKDELQSQLKEKLIEYKVSSEKCVSSSCIGKLTDIYDVKVPGMEAFPVSCDSSLAGSGWMVIQRRMDGSVNFNRDWSDYRQGFGNLSGEFFIGLDKLHLLTRLQPHELYIYLMDFKNETRYARYADFAIGSEEEFYKLKTLGSYSGSAGDSLVGHKNVFFTTRDKDHDTAMSNCGIKFGAGWWFHQCYHSNLNGKYVNEDKNKDVNGVEWRGWKPDRPMKFVQMMIKPKFN